MNKGIVLHVILDALFAESGCQPIVPVHVELHPEWCPRRDTKITQSEVGIDEVEVIVKTFARVIPHKHLPRRLVMPRLVGVAAPSSKRCARVRDDRRGS